MTNKEKNMLRDTVGNLKKAADLLNSTAAIILNLDSSIAKELEENDAETKISAEEQDNQERVVFIKNMLNDPRIEDTRWFEFRSITDDGIFYGSMSADTFKRLLASFIEKYDYNNQDYQNKDCKRENPETTMLHIEQDRCLEFANEILNDANFKESLKDSEDILIETSNKKIIKTSSEFFKKFLETFIEKYDRNV